MPLSPMFAFKDSPSSLRLLEIPKKIGEWNITTVKVAVNYPDNTSTTYTASRNGNVWVVTFNGCSITGKVANGLEVLADGTDENGDAVNGYVLGIGDIYILDRDADIEEAVSKSTMKYCDVMPETPVAGDVFIGAGAVEIYNGTQWISIDIDLSEYATKSEVETSASTLDSKIDSTKTELESSIAEVASDIPTYTSELENDSGFITSANVPTKTSELTNDSNFITSAQVEPSTLLGMNGYAANSFSATRLKALDIGTTVPTDRGIIIPTLNYDSATNTYTLDLYGSVGGYYPWYLRRLFGTDFSPVITLEWRKGTIWRKRVIGSTVRWSVTYNNNWMWVAKGKYAITCPTGDGKPDGNFYVLNYEDETHPNYINDPATDVHTITYNNNDITSIDGQAGGQTSQTIWCTRTNPNPTTIWERPFAYRNELPTKVSDLTNDAGYLTTVSWNDVQDKPSIPTKTSDLTNDSGFLTSVSWNDIQNKPDIPSKTSDLVNDSGFITSSDIPAIPTKTSDLTNDSDFTTNTALNTGLALKQDKLSNRQVSAINSVVDERTTTVKFVNGTVRTYDIVGEVTRAMLLDWEEEVGSVVKEVKFGNTVTSIGSDLFYFREQLTKATIPDSVTSIGSNAFYHCVSLTSIDIPDSVTYIGAQSFYECGLTSIHLPKNLKSLESLVFSSCNLTSIDLPTGLTNIKLSALDDNQYL